MEFVKSTIEMIPVEMEIMNSHPEYNLLSDGKRHLGEEDLLEEHLEKNDLDKERYLIQVGHDYIGIIDYIMHNPKDGKPWIGLLVIHNDWTEKSFAKQALEIYEHTMKTSGITEIRLGCFTENLRGMRFWAKQGFIKLNEITYNEQPLWVLEKKLTEVE
jgi:RimJ/RimL family protein N-acetyltransferase